MALKKVTKKQTSKKRAGVKQPHAKQTSVRQISARQISIADFDALDLVTSIELLNQDNDGKPVFHFIYGSQLYGTVFGVYGQFQGEEVTVGGKAAYEVQSVDLKMLNYKGVLNIGFTGDFEWNQKNRELTFGVQGANATVDIPYTFPTPLIVMKGGRFRLTFTRQLQALQGFEIYVDQRKGSNAGGKIKTEPPISSLFDSEFNERDGVDFYNRELRKGMGGFNDRPEFTSPRCVQSIVNLFF